MHPSSNHNGPRFKDQAGEVQVQRFEEEEQVGEEPTSETLPDGQRQSAEEKNPSKPTRPFSTDPPGNYNPSKTRRNDESSLKNTARDMRFKDQVTNRYSEGTAEVQDTRAKTHIPQAAQPMEGNLIVVNAVQVHAEDITISLPNSPHQREPKESQRSSLLSGEKAFLMKMMMLALFLNTLLAAGIVVGGFCLSGACGGNNAEITILTPEIGQPTPIPAPAPAAPTFTSVPVPMPQMVPTPVPSVISSNPGLTEGPSAEGPVGTQAIPILIRPTIPKPGGATGPPVEIFFSPPRPRPQPASSPPLATPVSLPIAMPTGTPVHFSPPALTDTLSPTFSPPTAAPTQSTPLTDRRTLMIAIVVPFVIVFEIILAGSLYGVYRRWRANRLVSIDAAKDSEAATDPSAV